MKRFKILMFVFGLILVGSSLVAPITHVLADDSKCTNTAYCSCTQINCNICTKGASGEGTITCTAQSPHINKNTSGKILNPNKCTRCDCTIYACSACWKGVLSSDLLTYEYTNICKVTAKTDENHGLCENNIINQQWYRKLSKVLDIVDSLLVPLLVVVGTAGAIFIIVLGVNYSKAESADKREEAKKRILGAIIGVVIMIILLVVIKLFTSNAYGIMKWINNQ